MYKKLLFLTLLVQFFSYGQQQWRPLGPDDFNKPTFNYAYKGDFAIDNNSIPYVAYIYDNCELGLEAQIGVRRFINGVWEEITSTGISTTYAGAVEIELDNNNIPYLVISKGTSHTQVYKLEETLWINLGTFGLASLNHELKFDTNNIPYVLGNQEASTGNLFVKKFDGVSWIQVGLTNVTTSPTTDRGRIALDSNNIPFVVFSDSQNNGRITVKKLVGNIWQIAGNALFSTGDVAFLNINIDNNNIPYVAYRNENGLPQRAHVKKLNGGTWEAVGSATGVSTGTVHNVAMTLNQFNQPVILYKDENADMCLVKYFDGTEWVQQPTTQIAGFGHAYLGADNSLYYGSYEFVHKLTGTIWEVLGSMSLSDEVYTTYVDMAMAPDNTIYLTYAEDVSGKIFVKKWNGTAWVLVGPESLTDVNVGNCQIVINSNNVPYVLFMNSNGQLVTKMFDGNSWINVGTIPPSSSSPGLIDAVIDSNNKLYVLYYVWVGGINQARVVSNNGSGWVNTGLTGALAQSILAARLAIGNDNIPVVAYVEYGSDSLVVKKKNLSANTWDIVGTNMISSGAVYYITIAIDSDNKPAVAYVDAQSDPVLRVSKFNGNIWEPVGSVIEGGGAYATIEFRNDNVPYVIYGDPSSCGKITVKKFTNLDWEVVGSEGFSSSQPSLQEPHLAITSTNVPIAIYNTNGIFARYFGHEDAFTSISTLDFVNLHSPASLSFNGGQTASVHARAFKEGVTEGEGLGTGVGAWIGVSTQNTHPSTWTTWIPATFISQAGTNDEFSATIGNGLLPGTYYYASRFQYFNGPYSYGGYSASGGGEWNNTTNVSGILTITCSTTAPIAPDIQVFCNSGLVGNLAATGDAIKWYSTETGGTPLAASQVLIDGLIYYATQTPAGGCESLLRTPVSVSVQNILAPTPISNFQVLCGGATVANLNVGVENDEVAVWYLTQTGGAPLATETNLIDGTTYYAARSLEGCESMARTPVNVLVNTTPSPSISTNLNFCPNGTIADLNAIIGVDVLWYSSATGGNPLSSDTLLNDQQTYYAGQTLNGCESLIRTPCLVSLISLIPPTAAHTQYFCSGATVSELQVTSAGDVIWYDSSTEGNSLNLEDELVNGTTYYAAQFDGICESQLRKAVTAIVANISVPTGDATQEFTVANTTLADIQIDVEAGAVTNWYANEADAAEGINPLEGSTVITNNTTYYVTQTVNGCTSASFAVTVSILLGSSDFTEASFVCYPNPVRDVLHFSYSETVEKIEVYNLLGQLVMLQHINSNEGSLNTSALTQGSYMVRIKSRDTFKTVKVIKQ